MVIVKVLYLLIAVAWFVYCTFAFRNRFSKSQPGNAVGGLILIWAMCMAWPITMIYASRSELGNDI